LLDIEMRKTYFALAALLTGVLVIGLSTGGCGGSTGSSSGGGSNGGNGGGGGSTTHTSVIRHFTTGPVDPWSPTWHSLSWTSAATATAFTSGAGKFLYKLGLPVSPHGYAVNWYSRNEVAGWDGQGAPPFQADTTFAVASAMTDRYFDDLNDPENNRPYQGYYTTFGFEASKAVELINAEKRPFILCYGNPSLPSPHIQFVTVYGMSWVTDNATGRILRVTSLRIWDRLGVLPTTLTPANTTAFGLVDLGVAYMEPAGASASQGSTQKGIKGNAIEVRGNISTVTWSPLK